MSLSTPSPRGGTLASLSTFARAHQFPLTLAAVLILLFLRKFHSFVHPQFVAEDGLVFWLGNYEQGIRALFTPYGGYQHLFCRLTAFFSGFFDPAHAPALFLAAAVLMHLAFTSLLFSPRVRLAWKPLFALAPLLVPHTGEVLGSMTNTQWVVSLALLLVALSEDSPRLWSRVWDVSIVLFLGLTGPFIIFFFPLYGLRLLARRTTHSWLLFDAAALAAAVQLHFMFVERLPVNGAHPDHFLLAATVGFRTWLQCFVGFSLPGVTAPSWGLVLGSLAIVCLLIPGLFLRTPNQGKRVFVFGAMMILVAAVVLKFRNEPLCITPAENGDRYFYMPRVLFVWLVLLHLDLPWLWVRRVAFAVSLAVAFASFSFFVDRPLRILPWESELQPVREGRPFSIPTNPAPEIMFIVSQGKAPSK